jgi:membrane protease YdiL (CAAX protease family)
LPTIATIAGAVLIATIGVILYAVIYLAAGHHSFSGRKSFPLTQQLIAQIVGYALAYVFMLRTVPYIAGTDLHGLGVRFPSVREIFTGIAGAGAMLFAVLLASTLVVKITHHEDAEAAMQILRLVHTNFQLALFIIATVIVAPLVEEFGFRVLVYNALERYTNVPVAAVLSSIVFGLVHGAGPSVYIPLALGGFVLVCVYIATQNYFANVITHAAFNLVVLTAALSHPQA